MHAVDPVRTSPSAVVKPDRIARISLNEMEDHSSVPFMPADARTLELLEGPALPVGVIAPVLGSSTSTFNPVVVAPTHNNAGTLQQVLDDLTALGLPVIVVNDGSTDATAEILTAWAGPAPKVRTVLTHDQNRGKAAALRTAFACASRAGFTHAASIDTDGQLSAGDIPALLRRAEQLPEALVLGVRDATADDYPSRSRWGRWVSNYLVRFETGSVVADSQCGLRVYPLRSVNTIHCQFGHYGYETEIITRSRWAGTPIVEVSVACRYFPAAQRVSHFKPFLDSLRALRMHGRLIAIAINPIRRRHRTPGSAPEHSLPRQFLSWINPMSAWRQVRGEHRGHTRFAAGFAAGVLVATLPLYGVQTLVSLFIAKRVRLNPVSVVAGANVSIPPVGPALIAAAIAVGHLMLHGSLPTLASYDFRNHAIGAVLIPTIIEWILGGIVLGLILAGLSFVGLNSFLGMFTDSPALAAEAE
jgi:uncharacterized protein (DUF2062 family)